MYVLTSEDVNSVNGGVVKAAGPALALLGGGLSGGAIGAEVGSVGGPVGIVVGGALGIGIGAIAGIVTYALTD